MVVPDEGDGEGGEEDEEDHECTGLECETAQEDGVRLVGLLVVLVRLADTDQCCAKNLENSRNDIGADEDPKDELWAQPFTASKSQRARPVDEAAEADVDGGGDEDWRGDDEEVLDDEVDNVVWVLLCGERTEGVAYYFHGAGEREGDEVPGAEAHDAEGVDAEGDEEEDYAGDAERERWGVAGRLLAPDHTKVRKAALQRGRLTHR